MKFPSVATNIISSGDAVLAHPGRLFFLVDYLQVKNSVDIYGSYFSLVFNIGLLFAVLFLPYFILWPKVSFTIAS